MSVDPSDPPAKQDDGILWVALERWLVRASTFICFIILARLIGAEDLGTAALVTSIAAFTAWVSEAGAGLYLMQLRRLEEAALQTVFWLTLGLGLLGGVALAVIGLAVRAVSGTPQIDAMLAVLGVTVVIQAASAIPAALLQRRTQFKTLALRQVVATSISIVVAIGLAMAGLGPWAIVGQAVVRNCVAALVLFVRGDFRPRLVFSRSSAQDFRTFSTRALPGQLLQAANDTVELSLVAATAGTTALGLWSVGVRLATVTIELTSQVFVFAAAPLISRQRESLAAVASFIRRSTAVSLSATGSVLIILSAVSPEIVPFAFGDAWSGAGTLGAVLALRAIPDSVTRYQRMTGLTLGLAGRDLMLTMCQVVGGWLILASAAALPLTHVALLQTAWLTVMVLLRAWSMRQFMPQGDPIHDLTLRLLTWIFVLAYPMHLMAERLSGFHPLLTTTAVAAIGLLLSALGIRVLAPPVWGTFIGRLRSLRQRSRKGDSRE